MGAGLAALVTEILGIRVMFAAGGLCSIGLLLLFLKFVPAWAVETQQEPARER